MGELVGGNQRLTCSALGRAKSSAILVNCRIPDARSHTGFSFFASGFSERTKLESKREIRKFSPQRSEIDFR